MSFIALEQGDVCTVEVAKTIIDCKTIMGSGMV